MITWISANYKQISISRFFQILDITPLGMRKVLEQIIHLYSSMTMKIGTTTMENTMAVPQKTKYGTTI